MTEIEKLKDIFLYDKESGLFTWKIKPNKRIQIGDVAGYTHKGTGYVRITFDGTSYRAHRLAWAFMTGSWPEKEIDHKDTNRVNNKWDNLRESTSQQNSFNRNTRSDNTSGVKGVYFIPKSNKWAGVIWLDGKRHYLGSFKTLEEATEVVVKERERLHKAFANNG